MSANITKEVLGKLLQEWNVKGGDMNAAYDSVFGIGAYRKLKDDVYDAIVARKSA